MKRQLRFDQTLLCIIWMPHAHTLKNAEAGLRQPVQVIEGNYQLMPGTCPWWDKTVAKRG